MFWVLFFICIFSLEYILIVNGALLKNVDCVISPFQKRLICIDLEPFLNDVCRFRVFGQAGVAYMECSFLSFRLASWKV